MALEDDLLDVLQPTLGRREKACPAHDIGLTVGMAMNDQRACLRAINIQALSVLRSLAADLRVPRGALQIVAFGLKTQLVGIFPRMPQLANVDDRGRVNVEDGSIRTQDELLKTRIEAHRRLYRVAI